MSVSRLGVVGMLGALLGLVGCRPAGAPPAIEGPVTLAGGKTLDAATLQQGREVFFHQCVACHGLEGKGDGPSSAGMRPPPRNLTQGLFKFSGTGAGNLPTDEALEKTLRQGLHGTPMLAWDLPAGNRHAVIQYLKTLSSRWKEEEVPPALELSQDPWKGREAQAIEKGRAVYHVMGEGHAGCASCHPGYLPQAEVAALYQSVNGVALDAFPEEPFRAQLRETEYPLRVNDAGEPLQNHKLLPTDFLLQPTKRVQPLGKWVGDHAYTEEEQRRDLYEVIAGGIGGAAMPTWKGALPEENLWALVYYVQSLVQLRGTPQALTLRQALLSSPPPPGAPVPDAGSR